MTSYPTRGPVAVRALRAIRALAASALALAGTASMAAPAYRYEIFTCGPWAQASTCGNRPLSLAFSFTTASILSVPVPPADMPGTSEPFEWNVLSQDTGAFSRAQLRSWHNVFDVTGWELSLFDPDPAASVGQTSPHLTISPFASNLHETMTLGLGVWDGIVGASCLSADARGVCHASTPVQSMLVIAVTMTDPPAPSGVPEPTSALLAMLGLAGLPVARRLGRAWRADGPAPQGRR